MIRAVIFPPERRKHTQMQRFIEMPGVLYEHVVGKECSFQQGAGIDPLWSFAVIEYKNEFPSAERRRASDIYCQIRVWKCPLITKKKDQQKLIGQLGLMLTEQFIELRKVSSCVHPQKDTTRYYSVILTYS